MSIRYVNCILTIKSLDDVVYKPPFAPPISGKLTYDPLTKRIIERLNFWVNYSIEEEVKINEPRDISEDMQILGSLLYDFLFGHQEIGDAFTAAYRDFQNEKKNDKDLRLRLRLIFEKDTESISTLPWEFLYMPSIPGKEGKGGAFLVNNEIDLILTRFIEPSDRVKQLDAIKEPLKILIVTVKPANLEAIDSDLDALKQALSRIEPKRIDIKTEENVTLKALQNAVERERPHILHFIGHGSNGKIFLIKDPDGKDMEEGKKNQSRPVGASDLKGFFANHKPRLILLQACQGAASNSEKKFQSVASALKDEDIPAVIAMQYSITNGDAKLFSQTIYEQLSQGKDIEEAVKEGRIKLGQNSSPPWGHPCFGIPVVYLQSEKAIIEFSGEEPKDTKQLTENTAKTEKYDGANFSFEIFPRADFQRRAVATPFYSLPPQRIRATQESKPVEQVLASTKDTTNSTNLYSEGSAQDEIKQEDKQSAIDIRTNRTPLL
jgi:CHAT domain